MSRGKEGSWTAEDPETRGRGENRIDRGIAELLEGRFSDCEATISSILGDLGKNDADAALAYETLGRARTWLANFKKAEEALSQSHKLKTKLHGDESCEAAVSNLYRAELCIGKDDYTEAYTLASTARATLEKLGPMFEMQLAHALTTLGVAAMKLNRPEEAEPLMSKALGIRSARLGEEHRLVGESLDALSQCHAARENFTMAGALGRKALAVRERTLGPEHPEVGITLYHLATQYIRTVMYFKAEAAARQGLPILQKSFPEDHPLVIRMSERLASACSANCMHQESEQLLTTALASAERFWGADHLNTVTPLVGLASANLYKFEFKSAEKMFSRSLKILEAGSEINPSLEYRLLNELSYCYLVQLKIPEMMQLTPDIFRARHTANFSRTIDLIRKIVEYAAKEIELASLKD